MNQQEKVFEILNALGIEYQVINHQAVFAAKDIEGMEITQYGDVCKNLFLRDVKGERHFLVVVTMDKKVDLKSLQKQLNCTRLSFASEESLYKYLHLQKGEATPLAVVNDPDRLVEIVLDSDLVGKNKLGFHPNINTATVWISFEALKKFIEHNGNRIHSVTI